jgi:hypothetical protein
MQSIFAIFSGCGIGWVGGDCVDLKNNHITVRELLENSASRAVLQRRFPEAIGLPIVATSGSLTLERAIKLVSAYVPQNVIQETIRELQRL